MKLMLTVASLMLALTCPLFGQATRSKSPQTTPPQAEAYFMFTDGKDTFVFKLTDPKKIQEARDILSGKQKGKVHVAGTVVTKPAPYNRPWTYHLNPDSISFFQISVEACDAAIKYVEEHLAEVGGAFLPGNRWCPWASRLVKEVSYPSQRLALVDSVAEDAPRLTGGFIQLGNAEKTLPRAKWDELLGEMRYKLGMDTVLVQALFYEDRANAKHPYIVLSEGKINADNPQYDPKMRLSNGDPTDAMLKYADDHGMEVYLGLWMEEIEYGTVGGEVKALEDFLKEAERKSVAAAELAWNLYHHHPSFKGWYIAHELWNFPIGQDPNRAKKQELLRQFLSRVVAKCRELNGRKEADGKGRDRPVAVSAFFNPWFDRYMAGPDVTTGVFTSILTGSGVSRLILQDSVAAKCLGTEKLDNAEKEKKRAEIRTTIMPEYLRAFYEAAKAASASPPGQRIQVWDDLEAYEAVSGRCPTPKPFQTPEAAVPFKPSNIARLKWQFEVATRDPMTGEPYADFETGEPIELFDKFVVFDVFHYMNTVIPEGFGTDVANTQRLRAELFNDYKREFVDGRLQPSSQRQIAPSRRSKRRPRSRN